LKYIALAVITGGMGVSECSYLQVDVVSCIVFLF
jgi:hypothetical protein